MKKKGTPSHSKPPKATSRTSEPDSTTSSTAEPERLDPTYPYPLAPNFVMELRGEWETGGVLEFFAGQQRLDFVRLSPAPWAVVATLFLASIHSQSTHWLSAFVKTKHLVSRLERYELASLPTNQTVYQHVNKIRSILAASPARKLTGNARLTAKQWAERVLQNGGRPGYRIGLPPSQLRLTILEDDAPWGAGTNNHA